MRCLLYDCFLLTFIKSLIFFIHAKIARFCLICWNSLRCSHTGRTEPVRSFVTVIGWSWARASLHFPAFFGRACTYQKPWNKPFSWTAFGRAFGLVNVCRSALFGEIDGSRFMLEDLLFFVNQLKSFFPVDGCQRLHILRSDFVFWFELLSFAFLRREISDSFSSLKLLFIISGWTSMLKQGSNSKFGNISPSSVVSSTSTSVRNNLFDPFSMKTTLPAAYFKNRGLTGSQTVQ